jgi:hypothetical protein
MMHDGSKGFEIHRVLRMKAPSFTPGPDWECLQPRHTRSTAVHFDIREDLAHKNADTFMARLERDWFCRIECD